MSDALQGIGKLVPGFDFLQGLVKSAGTALPNFTQWVAPTLNPEELEKRIGELRTVQFWLEQNARMLGATIQAMEVQRMTLSTLQTMNVPVEALRESLKVKVPPPDESEPAAPAAAPAASQKKPAAARKPGKSSAESGQPAYAAGAVDPMQWWGALTKQFTTLATNTMTEALKDTATESARNLAGSLVKQSFSAAEETLRKTMEPARKVAAAAGKAAASRKSAAPARKSSRAASAPKPPTKT
nr:PhaM family polyhydroxyalkanoate granule multifunctional regulatory protein [uncultured Caldimonas sp.]